MNSFPLLLPNNLNNTHYSGYITINGIEYFIDIQNINKKSNSLKGIRISCDLELEAILIKYKLELIQKLNWFNNLEKFLIFLKNLIEEKEFPSKPNKIEFNWYKGDNFETIISELKEFQLNCIKSINSKFTVYNLNIRDSYNRNHDIILKLDYNYPLTPPIIELKLPNNPNYTLSKSQFQLLTNSNKSIKNYLNICIKELDKYNNFWEVIDDINYHALIIDPNPIENHHTKFRISLGNMCYLELNINPNIPKSIPNYRLLGSEVKLKEIKNNLLENINNWNANELPSYNFRHNLNLTQFFKLPNQGQSTQNSSSNLIESKCCCICLEYKSTQFDKVEVPSFSCDNNQCFANYHNFCLIGWIKSLPNSRKSFKKWFGKCCICEEDVSIIEQ